MSWAWHLHRAVEPLLEASDPGLEISETFSSRSDAETWLGECWRDLRAGGVVAVSLAHDDQVVGPPLELLPNGDS